MARVAEGKQGGISLAPSRSAIHAVTEQILLCPNVLRADS